MSEKKLSTPIVYAMSAVAIIFWGLSYIWSGQLLNMGIPVEYFVFVRIMFASGILLLVNLALGIDIKVNRKDLPKFLLLGFCEPFIYFVCETYGISLTESPTYSAMIIATTPIIAMVAGMVFFKEKMSAQNIAGLFICLGGIFLVTMSASNTGDRFLLGVFVLIIAIFAEVGMATCTKWLAGDYKPQVITMYQFLIGGVYLCPLFFIKGLGTFEPALYLSWEVWRPILCLAAFCSCLCFTLWVSSIQHLGVAKSAVLQAVIPIITAIAGIISGTEFLSPLQWIGVGIASLGVVLSQLVSIGRKNSRSGYKS